jgi:cytochrome c-type biogenesis protein CcmE
VGFFKRKIARLNESDETRLAEELQEWARAAVPDSVPIALAKPRTRVRLAGVVRRITVRPVHGFDALQVKLYDGTGDVAVQWLGRRTVPGLTLGSRLMVEGMLGMESGDRKIVNPVYEFLPAPEA